MSETGLLSGEAALNSAAVVLYTESGHAATASSSIDNGHGTFFQGGYGFPSEHSAVAWSIASVMAHEYPGPLTKLLAYGLASTVTLTRVTGNNISLLTPSLEVFLLVSRAPDLSGASRC